jgi:hypothetical protein
MERANMAEKYFGVDKNALLPLTSRPITLADKEVGKKIVGGGLGGGGYALENMGAPSGQVLRFNRPDGQSANQKFANFRRPEGALPGRRAANFQSGDVLHFAEKAEAAAQINNRKDDNIFQIISRRYQITGMRNLQLQ